MRLKTMHFAAAALISAFISSCLLTAGCGAGASVTEADRAVAEADEAAAEADKAAVEADRAAAEADKAMENGAPGSGEGMQEAPAAGEQNGDSSQVASDDETIGRADVVKDWMVPVTGEELKDGVYSVSVDSSSSMFKVVSCELTVKDGEMTAVMTMGGKGYLKLYMGTGEEALTASEQDYIPFMENEEGGHTYEVPVEALDMGIDCSAFSKNKEKWYDRILVFRADSLPPEAYEKGAGKPAESLKLEDGLYTVEVTLEGGSGKARVQSPAALRMEGGKAFATIVWGSSNYDYMKVDGETVVWDGAGEYSTFEIPVSSFDWKLSVTADTIAMSVPHEIHYTLFFDAATIRKAE